MAQYNGNTILLKFDSVVCDALFQSVNAQPKNEIQDITAGSGVTHRQKAAGLDDYSFEITIIYDSTAATLASYIQKLKPGATFVLEYGPQGNAASNPRHVQTVIVEEAPFEVSVEKSPVAFKMKVSGSAAPSVNMYAGGVY